MDKAVIYARVSSLEQIHNTSLKIQLEKCRDFAKLKDFVVVGSYCDKGFSGKNFERPGFMEMFKEMNGYDIVLCYSLDRFSRSTFELLKMINKFREAEKSIYFLNPLIDINDKYGEFFITVLSAIAQLERNMILERAKSGIDKRFQEGKLQNRPPFGYDSHGNLIDSDAKKVLGIFKNAKKLCMNCLCKKFDIPLSSIRFILRNKFYAGYITYNGKMKKSNYPTIISESFFESVQKFLLENKNRGKSRCFFCSNRKD